MPENSNDLPWSADLSILVASDHVAQNREGFHVERAAGERTCLAKKHSRTKLHGVDALGQVEGRDRKLRTNYYPACPCRFPRVLMLYAASVKASGQN